MPTCFFLTFFSALAAWGLVVEYDFPSLSLGLFFLIGAFLVWILKKERTREGHLFFLLAALFSCLLFFRAQPLLVFLNLVAVTYCGSALILSPQEREGWGFVALLLAPLTLIWTSFQTQSQFTWHPFSQGGKETPKDRLYQRVLSVVITSALLLVVIPLLASANPIFAGWTNYWIAFFNLQSLFNWLFGQRFFLNLFRLLFFFGLALILPRLLSLARHADQKTFRLPLLSPPLLLAKVSVGLILILFFVSQAQLYFSSPVTLQALGYSHSQYAREVFAQLSLVALIIFTLVYNDSDQTKQARWTTAFLIVEGIFLDLMAYKSVFDYTSAWGFTYKRLYGYAVVLWVLGILLGFAYHRFRQLKSSQLIKGLLVYSTVILLGINVLNFDYLIYHYAKAATPAGIDHQYLSRLSPDAQAYSQQLTLLVGELEKDEAIDEEKIQAAERLWRKIERLKEKYDKLDLRTFNLSEYRQYQSIKTLDLEKISHLIEGLETRPENS